MHFGRSLLISLALCIVFFVLLRPEPPAPPPADEVDSVLVAPSDSTSPGPDSLVGQSR